MTHVVDYCMQKDFKFSGTMPHWRQIVERCETLSESERASARDWRQARQKEREAARPNEHASEETMRSWQDRQAGEMQREMNRTFNR